MKGELKVTNVLRKKRREQGRRTRRSVGRLVRRSHRLRNGSKEELTKELWPLERGKRRKRGDLDLEAWRRVQPGSRSRVEAAGSRVVGRTAAGSKWAVDTDRT